MADSNVEKTKNLHISMTLHDSKNNTLISIAAKRRKAGISNRQERINKNIQRRKDSVEKTRSLSRALAHQYSQIQHTS